MNYDTINDAVTMAGGAGTLLAGRYRIVRQLGQGGMGSVWLAEDTQLDNKPFAIKMLPSILVSNKRAYRQLKDEALVAMQLVHPNIVQIRAFEENNGNPFLVMDYVDGQTLDDYLAEHAHPLGEAASRRFDSAPLGEAASRRFDSALLGEAASRRFTGTTGILPVDVLRILRPIAAALDYAHAKGVVHRDVKPANVMIAKDGTPYILDFGIAREIQETMTRVTGKLSSGTLLYMSPEQLMGESPKPAQDIYSFAAMAYECLKGEPPFSHGQIEFQIMNKQPDPPPGGSQLVASVMAGLAKKPEDRPATCAAVLRGSGAPSASVGTVNGSGKSAASPNTQQPGGSRLSRPDEVQSGRGRSPSGPQSGGPRSVAALKGLIVAALLAIVGGVWLALSRTDRSPVREVSVPRETVDSSDGEAFATGGTSDTFVQNARDQDMVTSNANARTMRSANRPYDQQVLATVRAETTGYVKEICFKSGDRVEKGQVLFKLDDTPLRAVVSLREAEIRIAEAECRRAKCRLERMKKLSQAFTQKAYDEARADSEKSRAALLQAQTSLRRAEFELKKANIVAPASGKIRLADCIGDAVSPDSSFLAEILSPDSRIDAGDGIIHEVDVYPRTKGRVAKICMLDGDSVKEGDVLCRLDDEQATLLVEQCKTDVAVAEAEYCRAELTLERVKKAADQEAASQQSLDDAKASAVKAKAKVDVARAQLLLAEYEYTSTTVIAPASGILTRINVRIGDVVVPGKTVIVKMSRCKNFGLVSREAESRISSSIRISFLNQAPNGRIFVGFTDLSVQPSKNYFLAVGEKRGEWQVIEADPDNRLVTLSKYGTRVTVKLAGEDGASADKRKTNQERTVAEERKAAVVAETERRATHPLPAHALTPVWAKPAPVPATQYAAPAHSADPAAQKPVVLQSAPMTRAVEHPATYVVQAGDTLLGIAKRFYGSASKWRDIRDANKATVPPDGRLHVGLILKLPDVVTEATTTDVQQPPQSVQRQVYVDAHDKVQLWKGGPYWATTNIGAEKPEDYGYYFWWGDILGYKREGNTWVASDGSQSNFSFDKDSVPTCGKYIDALKSGGWITSDGVLAPEHDAAHVHWGGEWRMPTKQELDDLSSKCYWKWTTVNGVEGYEVRGKGAYASANIFLPCAGDGYGTSLGDAGSYGNYWSSVPCSDSSSYYDAWGLFFNSSYHNTYSNFRFSGQSVRPVQGFTK